jgi:hypothetical protein
VYCVHQEVTIPLFRRFEIGGLITPEPLSAFGVGSGRAIMKLHFIWAPGVPAALRKIERDTAIRILLALTRYAETGEGDVKALDGKFAGAHRLRVGDWRVRFRRLRGGAIYVIAVKNRGRAY